MEQTADGPSPASEFELVAESEIPFPPYLAVGAGTPLLVGGWCYPASGNQRVRDVRVSVDGVVSDSICHGLPRKDVYRKAAEAGPPEALRGAFESGFLAVAEVPPGAAGRTVAVEVIVTSRSGATARAKLGELTLAGNPSPGEEVRWAEGETEPRVAICMATYSPDPDQFERQIRSIQAQSHRNWICLISDDAGSKESRKLIESTVGDDPRFFLDQAPKRLGFYSNFERALGMVPSSADLIALADQDDRWDPDKIETLIEAVSPEDVGLAFSDSRVVGESGEMIHASYWALGRNNNHTNLASLIIGNTITGAASIFTPDVLRLALPFPHTPVNSFHDNWIACVALATSRIAYVDRPLYDYVQHDDAVIGFDAAMSGVNAPRAKPIRSLLSTIRDATHSRSANPRRLASSRQMPLTYYFGSTRMIVLAAAIRMRCGPRLTGRKLREVKRLETVDESTLSFLSLLLRRTRRFVGLNETEDIERTLAKGLLWRRLIRLRGRLERDPERIASDARIPILEQAVPGEAFRL